MNTQKTAYRAEEYLYACIAAGGGSLLWNRAEDGRWYQAQVVVDLFDSSLLELRWGGPLKNRNAGKTVFLDPLDAAARRTLVRRLCARRAQHGYTLVEPITLRHQRKELLPEGMAYKRGPTKEKSAPPVPREAKKPAVQILQKKRRHIDPTEIPKN
ncbi:hypothetical protein [Candidatus Igneacidithiobacillus taiwanensis]|uniref:hypothetical protein n=1 Tax=Candidatus Igneacidithiobacillus taiwanensis TaxID=1945924 RepID=UPI00289EF1C5|nr:hypothetical protein [Candidatus Igneacidithiobacillus taiwanensis]